MPGEEIHRLLELKERWICRHLEKFADEQAILDPLKSICLNGEKLKIELRISEKRKRPKVSFLPKEQICLIESPELDRNICLEALSKKLKKTARKQLKEQAEELSKKTGIKFSRLYVRDQKTRWGSSSGRGNISLNWRVIMLGADLQEYLIIHELCHQYNFNHSPVFWNSVGQFCPDYRNLNDILKNHKGIMALFR